MTAFACLAMVGWSQDIIIESYSDGKNSNDFSSVEGKWNESTGKSTAAGLTATKSVYNDADTAPGVARFTPDIPAAGQYEVFLTYPIQGNATGVKYTVVSADGSKDISLTQNGRDYGHQPKANTWYSLEPTSLTPGKTGMCR